MSEIENHKTRNLAALMISVVVPNYNGHGTLKQCLEAIRSSRYPSYECIVVDDGSTDNSLETAGVFADQIIQVKGGPLGPAHARNLGAQAARGEIVFFIDADVVVYPDTLDKVAASFTRSSPWRRCLVRMTTSQAMGISYRNTRIFSIISCTNKPTRTASRSGAVAARFGEKFSLRLEGSIP